jgi:beta-glucanase (GH16 family)
MKFTTRRSLIIVLAACYVAVSIHDAPRVQAQDLSGWNSIWNDEFTGTSVNTSRWEVTNRRDSPNNELQYYLPDQVTVSGGELHITATDQPIDGKQYRSGLVRTWQEHQYGRWEVRANLPTTQSMWPAIWLLPRYADWPVGGEIDIMENIGSEPYAVLGSYHYNWSPGSPITTNQWYGATENGQPVNFHESYHNYAVEWAPEYLRFYIDDNLYLNIDNPQQPADVPMSLIINLAVGGDFGGWPDGSTVLPQTFDIDYARYWTRNEYELINDSFDRSGSTLNGWTTFGNNIGNVAAQSEAVLDGTHSLKLFGQFDGSENVSGAAQGIVVTGGQEIVADASAFIRNEDSLAGSDNEVFMKLEYYSQFGGAYGGADFLSETPLTIADGSTAEDAWAAHQINDIAPAGAVEARLSFVYRQPGYNGGAIHIDGISLVATNPVIIGDLNGDGFVGALDLNLILGAWNASITPGAAVDPSGDGYVGIEDLNIVLGAWNTGIPPSATINIPEPASATGLLLVLAPGTLRRRISGRGA